MNSTLNMLISLRFCVSGEKLRNSPFEPKGGGEIHSDDTISALRRYTGSKAIYIDYGNTTELAILQEELYTQSPSTFALYLIRIENISFQTL